MKLLCSTKLLVIKPVDRYYNDPTSFLPFCSRSRSRSQLQARDSAGQDIAKIVLGLAKSTLLATCGGTFLPSLVAFSLSYRLLSTSSARLMWCLSMRERKTLIYTDDRHKQQQTRKYQMIIPYHKSR